MVQSCLNLIFSFKYIVLVKNISLSAGKIRQWFGPSSGSGQVGPHAHASAAGGSFSAWR